MTCLTIGTFSIIRHEASIAEEKVSPLRQWVIEDMRIRSVVDKAPKAHIRPIKDFAPFHSHSPDTATPK